MVMAVVLAMAMVMEMEMLPEMVTCRLEATADVEKPLTDPLCHESSQDDW